MKRFLDFLTNSPAAVTFAVLSVLGIVVFAVPGLHPFAWIIGLILCIGVILALLMFHGEWRRAQRQIDSLRQLLSTERGRLDTLGLTPVDEEVTALPDEERARVSDSRRQQEAQDGTRRIHLLRWKGPAFARVHLSVRLRGLGYSI